MNILNILESINIVIGDNESVSNYNIVTFEKSIDVVKSIISKLETHLKLKKANVFIILLPQSKYELLKMLDLIKYTPHLSEIYRLCSEY